MVGKVPGGDGLDALPSHRRTAFKACGFQPQRNSRADRLPRAGPPEADQASPGLGPLLLGSVCRDSLSTVAYAAICESRALQNRLHLASILCRLVDNSECLDWPSARRRVRSAARTSEPAILSPV